MHQPNFLPWMGFFYKIAKADLFINCDVLDYSKGSYTQRVKIKTMAGPKWLSLPIVHTGTVGEPINKVICGGWPDWRDRIVNAFRGNYSRAKHFQPYCDQLAGVIASANENVAEFNTVLIQHFFETLQIKTPMVMSSSLSLPPCDNPTDWIIAVCKSVGADTFLSGFGGAKYQDQGAYEQAGIKLVYTDFKHPSYPQLFGEFVPGLSAMDLLLNCGPHSQTVLGI
ncbi:MAG: WbqC family protein [Planctomycetes bacterium]|nr:WbqC family protein [Planctomycetota bacterium]MCG2684275.1 WbqC family protein [Planctomycetales bacterium]